MESSINSIETFYRQVCKIKSHEQNQQHYFDVQMLANSLFLQTSDYKFVTTQVLVEEDSILIFSTVLQSNGRPIEIKSSLATCFLELINKKKENIKFTLHNKTASNIQIQYIQKNPMLLTVQKIMKQIYKAMIKALQIIGKNKKINSIQKLLYKQQLVMRKQAIMIIKQKSSTQFSYDYQRQEFQQNTAVQKVQRIIQLQNLKDKNKVKTGGYCSVQPVRCLIYKTQKDHFEQILAVKRSINPGNINIYQKIQKQLQITKMITNSQNSCKYYITGEDTQIYMSYAPITLRQYIHKRNLNFSQNIQKLINLSQQIIKGVKILHNSGIIHRDLKPENILISEINGQQKVHIIDFGESTTVNQINKDRTIGCTFPYSPIQCLLGRQEGFNNKEIDLWSVNIILYQMVFKTLPISFNMSISLQIVQDWVESPIFTTYQSYRRKKGLAGIPQLFSLISMSGLQINQNKRLSLNTMNHILSLGHSYYLSCMKINQYV